MLINSRPSGKLKPCVIFSMQQQKLKIKLPACAYDQINRQYNYNTTEIKTACKIQRKKLFVERGKINNMFSRSMTNHIDECTENTLRHER